MSDANLWRKLPYAVLLASLLIFGFFPGLITEKVKPEVERIVALATASNQAEPVETLEPVVEVAATVTPAE